MLHRQRFSQAAKVARQERLFGRRSALHIGLPPQQSLPTLLLPADGDGALFFERAL